MLTIKGIGKYRRVHASEIFGDEACGVILPACAVHADRETKAYPNLLLYQDGEATPVSDLMGRENHIFAVVPKVEEEAEIDWRLPVFEAGKYLIAFDACLSADRARPACLSGGRRCCSWRSGGGGRGLRDRRQSGDSPTSGIPEVRN